MTINRQDEENKKKRRRRIIITILLIIIIIILLLLRSCHSDVAYYPGGNETKVMNNILGDKDPGAVIDSFDGSTNSSTSNNDIVDTHAHKWILTEEVEATCQQEGHKIYTCSDCNEIVVETSPILEHDYDSVTYEPTCTQQGETVHTCAKCGDRYSDHIIPALGHDYSSVVTDPTCTEDGYTTYTCNRCGDTYQGDVIPALGHDYQYDRDESVDEGNGKTSVYKVYKCSVCGDEYQDYWYTTFSYVGAVQEYNVIKDGIYKVEAYGAQSGSGEKGGYVSGEVELHEGDTLYVAVGGQGGKGINYQGVANAPGGVGGWNGGGNGGNGGYRNGHKGSGAGGGGATSIALADADATDEEKEKLNNTLAQVGKEEFDENGLIVAGGAGGANYDVGRNSGMAGGNTDPGTSNFGQGNNGRNGRNAANYGWGGGGGGGGYYGGYSSTGAKSQPRGGSSWTNEDMIDEATVVAQSDVKSGNGQAQITFLEDLPEETPAETPEVPAETPAETPESTEA